MTGLRITGRRIAGLRGATLAVALLLPAGCIPYAVSSTAHTVPEGETERNSIIFVIPQGVEPFGLGRADEDDDNDALSFFGMDQEWRWGINDHADVGLRLLTSFGVVGTYKRRLVGSPDGSTAAMAFTGGIGLVNGFNHAHFKATLTASAGQRTVTPYGGLRIMQVAPISPGAVHDTPTAGGFFGARIESGRVVVIPEVGLYRDESALNVRDTDHIVVLSMGFQGVMERLRGTGDDPSRRPPTQPFPPRGPSPTPFPPPPPR